MKNLQYDCSNTRSFQIGSATFWPTGRDVHMTGVDTRRRSWTMLVRTGDCAFWHADLDADGSEDFIFYDGTGAHSSGLVVVLFDSERRPIPWRITGDFEKDQNGIVNFVDLNQDGRAELLATSKGGCSKPNCRVTQLYCRYRRVSARRLY